MGTVPPSEQRGRLRVCYVVSYFHPFASGAERQAMAQGKELARRGHSVHVVTHAVSGYNIPDEEVDGVFIHRWIHSIQQGPLFGLSFVAGVIRALHRLRPLYDVVHTHQALWEAVATGLGRSWIRGVPTLVQPASSGYYGEAEELRRTRGFPLLRRAILRNTAFAAISADIEDQWRDLGVPPGRIVRTASGVDTTLFRPGTSTFEASLLPRPRVLFTGRLHPQKNLDLLLEAWPAVARRTAANLVLAGPGEERTRLEAKARTLGVADRVQFTGAVVDVADVLRGADVFVLPSVAEGMSNSLLEAMATALPCVASGIGGNVDLLSDGVTGVLVSSREPSAWSNAILELLDDPSSARSLGAAAQRTVDATFALPVVVDRYVDIYRSLIAGSWPDRAG
ncbi:MAG: glycosyltransferase family 4 protein [Isosphaeraceae bacterium]|nr:glycosyltransferase family 4 protein [Isosphaeraceae bacterium]